MSLRAGEPAHQCLCAAAEAVRRGARLQRHSRPVEGYVAGAEVTHESGADEDHRELVQISDRLHRRARDNNADHPLPQLTGTGRQVAPDGFHRQRAARMHMQDDCPVLVEGDLARAIR